MRMRTAQSIEASEARKDQTKPAPAPRELRKQRAPREKPDGRGRHPNSHTAVGKRFAILGHAAPNKWKPGQSGNPSGRPKNDIAREIAKAVFENNKEKLYKAFAKAALKGNAYAFSQLADRAYGKLKERVEFDVNEYRDVSESAILDRILELETQLGIARQIDAVGRDLEPEARALPPSSETKD